MPYDKTARKTFKLSKKCNKPRVQTGYGVTHLDEPARLGSKHKLLAQTFH